MLRSARQTLHHALLARALFSTDTAPSSLKNCWTIQQQLAGASKAETLHINPDGKYI